MNKLFYYLIIISFSYSTLPYNISFESNYNHRDESSNNGSLPSNSVVDIRQGLDSYLFYGTSGGLGYSFINEFNELKFGIINSDSLPEGSNPALMIRNNIIAVSGGELTEISGNYLPTGTGIGYSFDGGENWHFKPQSIDPIPNQGVYQSIIWGGQSLEHLSVTTPINNISYDLAIIGEYIYSTSWAGGLRRFKHTLPSNIMPGEDPNPWEIIPLPMDSQFSLECGNIDIENFEINPNDPINGGSHNHKGFSVYSYDENTIWVGTASGINKGTINPDTDCIDWVRYTSFINGFSGDWVIGFTNQELETHNRIWAITWSTEYGQTNAISYSDNEGLSWNIPSQIEEMNIKFYNLFAYESILYAASEEGLFVSYNGEHWAKFTPVESINGQVILSETIYTVINTNLNNVDNNAIWIGSPDGVARTYNQGIDWEIFWGNNIENTNSPIFFGYPNPFYINEYNQFNGNGYIRFSYNVASEKVKLNIFNFSMEDIIQINNSHIINNNQTEFIWNGRDSNGYKVSNGVYFCRLSDHNRYYWTKIVIIN